MKQDEVAGYIAGWKPASAPPEAACFARTVVRAAGPADRDRAKSLLWAAGQLACYGIGLGLEPVPVVPLHPSVMERFTAHSPGLSEPVRGGSCCLRVRTRDDEQRTAPGAGIEL